MNATTVDDELFFKIKLAKQQTELIKAIRELTDAVKAPVTDPALMTALQDNKKAIAVFIRKINELAAPDNQAVVEAINSIQMPALPPAIVQERQITQWHFDVEYDQEGKLSGITATAIT
jgi:hypothetical protein